MDYYDISVSLVPLKFDDDGLLPLLPTVFSFLFFSFFSQQFIVLCGKLLLTAELFQVNDAFNTAKSSNQKVV